MELENQNSKKFKGASTLIRKIARGPEASLTNYESNGRIQYLKTIFQHLAGFVHTLFGTCSGHVWS